MEYLNPNEQDDLKQMLYGYLKDKAQRRAGVTSKAEYEGAEDQFAKQMQLSDTGALLGGLSEAGSMAGQIQGKRAESDIIPKVNQNLYNTTQGAYENFRTLRDQEERSNMNDLQIAQYLRGLEEGDRRLDLEESRYKDLEPRRKLELQLMQKKAQQETATRRKFEPRLVGPGGSPVVLDEAGNPTELPTGFKINEKMAQQDPYGDLRRQQMEAGIERTKAQTDALKNRPQQQNIGAAEKSQISALGTKLANQASIVNVLAPARDSLVAAMRAGNKDLAIKIGQGMIKALNSDQGADAVGVEEAARLGNLLEFQIFNLTQPGPMFGRDLEGFSAQVDETINKLKSSVAAGQKQLKQLEAGQPIQFEESKGRKSILKKQYSPSRNKTKIIYSDGTEEVVDGRQ